MAARALAWMVVAVVLASQACSIKKVTFKPIGAGGAAGTAGTGTDGGPGGAMGAAGKGGAGAAAGGGGAAGAGGMAGAAGNTGAGGMAGAGGNTGAAGMGGAAGARDAGVDLPGRGGSPVDGGRRDAVAEAGADGPPACPYNLVAVMTSNSAPSGLVFSSGSIDDTMYDGWRAFDADHSSMWISAIGQDPAILGYIWTDGPPRTVVSYAITYANGSILTRAPSAWTLEGLSGDEWVPVDAREGQTGWAGTERRLYTVASPGAYPEYRLNITDDNDAATGIVVISIGNLELIGCPTPPPAT